MNARVTEPKQGEAVAVDAPKVAEAKPAPEPAPAAPVRHARAANASALQSSAHHSY